MAESTQESQKIQSPVSPERRARRRSRPQAVERGGDWLGSCEPLWRLDSAAEGRCRDKSGEGEEEGIWLTAVSLLRFHRLLHGCIYCLYATYTEIHSIYFRLTPFVGEYNTIQAYSRFSKSQWHKGNINGAVEIWRDLLALLTSSSCWRQWVRYRVFICAVDSRPGLDTVFIYRSWLIDIELQQATGGKHTTKMQLLL